MKTDSRKIRENRFQAIIASVGIYAIIAIILIIGLVVNKNFLTFGNFVNIINNTPYIGLLCVGFSFVTYAGYMVDMSVPAVINTVSMLTVICLPWGLIPALLMGVAVSIAIGLFNGYIVGKFRINPIIWTISINFLINGTLRFVFQNKQVYPNASGIAQEVVDVYIGLARTRIWGIHIGVYITIALTAIAYLLMTKTVFGRQLKIMGSNMNVAKACGINHIRNTMIVYVFSAFSACLAGTMLASLSRVGSYLMGDGYEFNAITACVIGGMSLSGARGNPIGVFGGVITLMVLSNVLIFCGFGTYEQNVVKGTVFILIVFVNSLSLRTLGRDDA